MAITQGPENPCPTRENSLFRGRFFAQISKNYGDDTGLVACRQYESMTSGTDFSRSICAAIPTAGCPITSRVNKCMACSYICFEVRTSSFLRRCRTVSRFGARRMRLSARLARQGLMRAIRSPLFNDAAENYRLLTVGPELTDKLRTDPASVNLSSHNIRKVFIETVKKSPLLCFYHVCMKSNFYEKCY